MKTHARWQSVDDPLAYTRTVLTRLAIRADRRRWRGEIPTGTVPEIVLPDPVGNLDSEDLLDRALAALPTEQRAVVVLRYYYDYSEAEIATVMKCSVGTVKSRAHRALVALRLDRAFHEVEVADE